MRVYVSLRACVRACVRARVCVLGCTAGARGQRTQHGNDAAQVSCFVHQLHMMSVRVVRKAECRNVQQRQNNRAITTVAIEAGAIERWSANTPGPAQTLVRPDYAACINMLSQRRLYYDDYGRFVPSAPLERAPCRETARPSTHLRIRGPECRLT